MAPCINQFNGISNIMYLIFQQKMRSIFLIASLSVLSVSNASGQDVTESIDPVAITDTTIANSYFEKQPSALLSNIELNDLPVTSWILVSNDTKKILLENESNTLIPPASMTKVMTAYIVFDYLKSNRINEQDEVLVSEKAWRIGGSKQFIEVNKTVKVIDLLRGLIIQSGNDSAIALAEHIAGTEASFASLMNQYAAKLGMTNSNFKNASGWPDPEHLTTANDLAVLTVNLIDNFPNYYAIYKEREFTYNGITQQNRNRLIWKDARVDGVKTGHTEEAGYCLIGSSIENDSRFTAVVTGAVSVKSREDNVHALLKFAHANYLQRELITNEKITRTVRVLEGSQDEVALVLSEKALTLLPQQIDVSKVEIQYQLPSYITAPIDANAPVGSALVVYNQEILGEFALHSAVAVPQGGFFSRMIDKIKALLL